MTPPPRSHVPRRQSDTVVTYAWLQRQVLIWLGSAFLLGMSAAWKLSAQNSDVRRDVQDAKDAIPRIEQQLAILTHEVQRGNKTQDSLLAIFADRERRVPINPMVGR